MSLRQKLTRQSQMSEAFILSAFLAFSGGFQDAYTYIVRDHVFANAQTGNVVLLSTCLLSGQWRRGLLYLFPLLAFACGVVVAEQIQARCRFSRLVHWRQGILLLEMGILLLAGFFPAGMDTPANMLISFSCAMQVQSFRTVGGHAYASTMCIGNLRSGTAALSAFLRTRDRGSLVLVRYYFGMILIFALGAGIGGNLSSRFGVHSIWITLIFLLIGVLLMELDRNSSNLSEKEVHT